MRRPVLGIDIAKAKFDTCLLLPDGTMQRKVFPNTLTGFELLMRWLAQHTMEPVHACLEATGTYGAALALFLHEQQHMVSLINPAAIKAFAASTPGPKYPDSYATSGFPWYVHLNGLAIVPL
ncbi:MAG: transposase [Chloroflexota bacterium]|nr:transposase [Chloroflexota bacterium]